MRIAAQELDDYVATVLEVGPDGSIVVAAREGADLLPGDLLYPGPQEIVRSDDAN